MSEFLTNYDSQNLVKDKTCLKNPDNPRCIDRYIINSCGSYQNTTTVVVQFIGCSYNDVNCV